MGFGVLESWALRFRAQGGFGLRAGLENEGGFGLTGFRVESLEFRV